jgi:hypothetical protein
MLSPEARKKRTTMGALIVGASGVGYLAFAPHLSPTVALALPAALNAGAVFLATGQVDDC